MHVIKKSITCLNFRQVGVSPWLPVNVATGGTFPRELKRKLCDVLYAIGTPMRTNTTDLIEEESEDSTISNLREICSNIVQAFEEEENMNEANLCDEVIYIYCPVVILMNE